MSKIGKNIKKIRKVKGLSQQAFGEMFKLTRGNISSYEEMRAEPRIEVAAEIAKYFSIPLNDLISRDLSVNELLHYDTELVLEPEKLNHTSGLAQIPYIPIRYQTDYITHFQNNEFTGKLPFIIVPNSSRFKLIALEIDDPERLPSGYDYKKGDVLIFESINRENVHRIQNKFGLMIDPSGFNAGIFEENNGQIHLALNKLVQYPFNLDSNVQYWVLRAVYLQTV